MNCPYCNKEIYAFTGFQEIQKFQKHLRKCKKNPDFDFIIDKNGKCKALNKPTSMLNVLEIRAKSGQ